MAQTQAHDSLHYKWGDSCDAKQNDICCAALKSAKSYEHHHYPGNVGPCDQEEEDDKDYLWAARLLFILTILD